MQPTQGPQSSEMPELMVSGNTLVPVGRNVRAEQNPAGDVSDMEMKIFDFVLAEILLKLFVGQLPSEGILDLVRSRGVCRRWNRVVSGVFLGSQRVWTAALGAVFRKSCRFRDYFDCIQPTSVQFPPYLRQIPLFGDMFENTQTTTRLCQGLTRSLKDSKDPNKIKIIVDAVADTVRFCPDFLVRKGYMQYVQSKALHKELISLDSSYFALLSSKDQEDREIVLHAVGKGKAIALNFTSAALRADREIILKAVSTHGESLMYASSALKNDREVVLTAVKESGLSIKYASELLKRDRELVLAAVRQSGDALEFLSGEFQDDDEVVSEAMRTSGGALQYASLRMRDNKGIVLQAVQQDGASLEHASSDLQADKEVVLAAVQQKGWAIRHARGTARTDKGIALAAVQQCKDVFIVLEKSLQEDDEICQAAR